MDRRKGVEKPCLDERPFRQPSRSRAKICFIYLSHHRAQHRPCRPLVESGSGSSLDGFLEVEVTEVVSKVEKRLKKVNCSNHERQVFRCRTYLKTSREQKKAGSDSHQPSSYRDLVYIPTNQGLWAVILLNSSFNVLRVL